MQSSLPPFLALRADLKVRRPLPQSAVPFSQLLGCWTLSCGAFLTPPSLCALLPHFCPQQCQCSIVTAAQHGGPGLTLSPLPLFLQGPGEAWPVRRELGWVFLGSACPVLDCCFWFFRPSLGGGCQWPFSAPAFSRRVLRVRQKIDSFSRWTLGPPGSFFSPSIEASCLCRSLLFCRIHIRG